MAENSKEWPRCHTCLFNWCPAKNKNCEACDKVLEIVRNQQPLGDEFQKVLNENRWDLYAR